MGVFDAAEKVHYPHRYKVTLKVGEIHGATPCDPEKAKAWIAKAMGQQTDEEIQNLVLTTMAELGLDKEAAEAVVLARRHLNAFKRTAEGELYLEGRCVKAMLKEVANICWPKRKWGPSNKGTHSFFAEHVFVLEKAVGLGVNEPTGIDQRFVHTWRGNGIQYEEFVVDAEMTFTIVTDTTAIEAKDWEEMWVKAQHNGLGGARSQGYGTFEVVGWEKEKVKAA